MAVGWLTERVCVVGTKIGLITTKSGDPTNRSWIMSIDEAHALADVLIDAIEMANHNRENSTDELAQRTMEFIQCAKK